MGIGNRGNRGIYKAFAFVVALGLVVIWMARIYAFGDFKVKVSDVKDTGKIEVTYRGDEEYGAVIMLANGYSNTYAVKRNSKEIISLPYGNGDYTIKTGVIRGKNKVEILDSLKLSVNLRSRISPFTGKSYYTDYNASSISSINRNGFEKEAFIKHVVSYVYDRVEYDNSFKDMVDNNKVIIHKPNIKKILSSNKGVCIDQASLAASILRCNNIPTRIVVGYNPNREYHAWIDVFEDGYWISYDVTENTQLNSAALRKYRAVRYY